MSQLKIKTRPDGRPARSKASAAAKPAWQAVFASEADYNQSVTSVVARIKSGDVLPRTPDEV